MLIDVLCQYLFEDSRLFAIVLNFSLKYYSIVFLGYYDEGPIAFIAIYGKASYVIVFILQNEYYAPCEG